MYKNRVESLRDAGDCKKNLQENIGKITAERNSFKKFTMLLIFEQGYPTCIK